MSWIESISSLTLSGELIGICYFKLTFHYTILKDNVLSIWDDLKYLIGVQYLGVYHMLFKSR